MDFFPHLRPQTLLRYPLPHQLTLLTLSIAGAYFTWYFLLQNGTVVLMEHIRDETRLLPGTTEPVKTDFTGVGWLDHRLAVMVVFFWEVVDGSRPTAGLLGYWFAGLVVPGWGVLMVESLRRGNRGKVVSFLAIWGVAVQFVAYAIIIPMYLAVHFGTSPDTPSADDLLLPIPDTIAVLPALALGYVLPNILMVLPAPSVLSFETKQSFIALWQFFPLWVGILQFTISFAVRKAGIGGKETRQRQMASLRWLYGTLLFAAVIAQWSTLQLVAVSHAFPGLFAPEYRGLWNLGEVFWPRSFRPGSVQVGAIGEGAQMLLQYDAYIGNAALVRWAYVLLMKAIERAKPAVSGLKYVGLRIAALVLGGVLGLVVCCLWARDEIVFSQEVENGKGKDE